jgi:hypothetical protein
MSRGESIFLEIAVVAIAVSGQIRPVVEIGRSAEFVANIILMVVPVFVRCVIRYR